MGPAYAGLMAFLTAIIRMAVLGIPPLALTGALFGAIFAGCFYKLGKTMYYAMFGEFIGTGLLGSLLSFPVMILFTGSQHSLYWFIYTPRFIGATLIGSLIAFFVLRNLMKTTFFQQIKVVFERVPKIDK